MDLETALQHVKAHFQHAIDVHPETKTANQWTPIINARICDLYTSTAADEYTDHKLVAGKRALQIAAIMLKMIDDLDLGLVSPEYDVGALTHHEP